MQLIGRRVRDFNLLSRPNELAHSSTDVTRKSCAPRRVCRDRMEAKGTQCRGPVWRWRKPARQQMANIDVVLFAFVVYAPSEFPPDRYLVPRCVLCRFRFGTGGARQEPLHASQTYCVHAQHVVSQLVRPKHAPAGDRRTSFHHRLRDISRCAPFCLRAFRFYVRCCDFCPRLRERDASRLHIVAAHFYILFSFEMRAAENPLEARHRVLLRLRFSSRTIRCQTDVPRAMEPMHRN